MNKGTGTQVEPDSAGSTYAKNERFSKRSVLLSEQIYGEGFQTSGGLNVITEALSQIEIPMHAKVLDIGCGTGGASIHISQKFCAHIDAVDSSNCSIELAKHRACSVETNYINSDISNLTFPPNYYDLIWSADALMYIPKIYTVFKNCQDWLKLGGSLCGTDYCCGDKLSTNFKLHAQENNMYLETVSEYESILDRIGFQSVNLNDNTDKLLNRLTYELAEFQKRRDLITKAFSYAEYSHLENRWKKKLDFCETGQFRWVTFEARR